MEYWKTYQKKLILEHLSAAEEAEVDITVWQQYGQERKTFTGILKNISRQLCHLCLKDKNADIDKERPIFVHIPGLDTIFKKNHYTYDPGKFEFTPPSDIQIHEKRALKRYYYQYQDHKCIIFNSELKDPATGQPTFTSSSVLVDISIHGAGMVISKETRTKISTGQTILLTHITDQILPAPFKVTIVYIEDYNHKEDGLHKIGILFNDELDSISYKSISSVIELKQKKNNGLDSTLYCGLGYQQQIKMLNKIEKANVVLANNIRENLEYLDQLRYLTSIMKVELLQGISHDLLAVALRLSSKELIYDLFSEVTKTMQQEFLEKFQTEKPASGICKAQDEIIKFLRKKEATGEIVLDPNTFTTYV